LTPLQRIVRQPLFWITLVLALFALPIGRSMLRRLPEAPKVFAPAPDFRLTDETGRPFERARLDGRVWVADFIFTRCAGACPLMSARMEKIQKRTRQLGRAFHMVSFTADPERDGPEELAAYARRYHANPRGWNFLTGPRDEIERVARAMLLGVGREMSQAGLMEIVHAEKLVLVDQRGRIRGYFDATDDGVDELVSALALVVNAAP